jgi:hypothetical protein
MTTLLLVMGFLVLAVAGIGLGLWQMVRLSRHGRRMPPELAQPAPLRTYSYGPMSRLFDGRDLQFLLSQRGWQPGMKTRLRRERREVLSLYLRQARAEFRATWANWRAIAPSSQDPEFASAMVKQFLAFHALYAVLRVHCVLGSFIYVRTDAGSLLAILRRLQQRNGQAMRQRSTDRRAATAR